MALEMNSRAAITKVDEGWVLPLFIHRKNKYSVGVLLAVVATVMYLGSNHIHFFQPQLLPMNWIDRGVPFLPHTVWIYVSEYLLFMAVFAVSKDVVNLNRYAYAFLAQQALSVIIFSAWPTTYPRDLFPLPQDLDALTYYVFSSLRNTDTPASCCPSLHVSSVFLSSYMFLNEQREKFPFFFLWAASIGVTTLTTKQHYLVDVITGFLMSVIIYWVFRNLITYRDPLQAKR